MNIAEWQFERMDEGEIAMTKSIDHMGLARQAGGRDKRERWTFYMSIARTAFAAASLGVAVAWLFLGGPAPPL